MCRGVTIEPLGRCYDRTTMSTIFGMVSSQYPTSFSLQIRTQKYTHDAYNISTKDYKRIQLSRNLQQDRLLRSCHYSSNAEVVSGVLTLKFQAFPFMHVYIHKQFVGHDVILIFVRTLTEIQPYGRRHNTPLPGSGEKVLYVLTETVALQQQLHVSVGPYLYNSQHTYST